MAVFTSVYDPMDKDFNTSTFKIKKTEKEEWGTIMEFGRTAW